MRSESDVAESADEAPHRPDCGLPGHVRLLAVAPTEPSWVRLTLALDRAGVHEPRFRWCSTAAEALRTLRSESYDGILVADLAPARDRLSQRAEWDATALVRSIRAAGGDDPVMLITASLDDEAWAELCRLDCDVLVSAGGWDSAALVPMFQRALTRVEAAREKHRLTVAQERRLLRERDEAAQLLERQRQMARELGAIGAAAGVVGAGVMPPGTTPLPPQFDDYYLELLRTSTIMGSGSLGAEIARLAEWLADADVPPGDALALHLQRVEMLVRGLGGRSARHVIARADLLALELMIHLAELYRQRG